MQKILLVGCLLLALIAAPVNAQEENYRLHTPTVEEYMLAIPAIVEQAYAEGDYYNLGRLTVSQEFDLRYADTHIADLPFDLLRDFQTALAIGVDIFLSIDERDWFKAMLEAGLREVQASNLSDSFTFDNFDIISTLVDFNGDDSQEYLLEVQDDWSMRRFYALVIDETVHMLPLPIAGLHGDLLTRGSAESGQLTIMDISDLDEDGADELIVNGDQYGYWASCGDLYIIDWHDGKLVDLTGELFSYCLPLAQDDTASVEFNMDQPVVIQMIETRTDGWNCQLIHTDTLNLRTNTSGTDAVYRDTAWCDLREASEAFDQHDYARAAEIYSSSLSSFEGQLEQYLNARLALAYALDGQVEQARSVLETAKPSGQMGTLLRRLRTTDVQPEAMCRTAYDFFVEINLSQENQYTNPYEWTPLNFYFGRVHEDPRYYPLPVPAQAGCDYRQIMGIEPTPVPTLEDRIPDVHSFVRFDVYGHLKREEYTDILARIDSVLALPEENLTGYELQLKYWRALTLELMGRPEDALVEYVDILETAPESAWGMLASLHIEETEN